MKRITTLASTLFVIGAGLGACAVTGVGVGYEDGYYDGGFYEPYGYEYGGWGGGYRVGPPRGDWRGGGGPRGGPPPGGPRGGPGPGGGGHSWQAPSHGGGAPSIPGRPRGR
jgi:hypothetical protein